jgi:Pyruvate/2-oxoacid:ferredoxin oxidoreductase delta subunit
MCPDQAITKDDATHEPVIDLNYCKGCGLCAHFCPKGAITMEPEQAGD